MIRSIKPLINLSSTIFNFAAASGLFFLIMATGVDHQVSTSFAVDNLHCTSCQSTIHNLLERLEPPPKEVLSSITKRSVILQHHKDLSRHTIQGRIRDAGFILGGDNLCRRAFRFIGNLGRSQLQQVHMSYCRVCQEAQKRARLGVPGDSMIREDEVDNRYDSWMG